MQMYLIRYIPPNFFQTFFENFFSITPKGVKFKYAKTDSRIDLKVDLGYLD